MARKAESYLDRCPFRYRPYASSATEETIGIIRMSVLRSLIRIGGFTREPVFAAKRFYRSVEVRGGYKRA